MSTSMGHDLTRRDPAGSHNAVKPYDPAITARTEYWASITPEQMQAVVDRWKAGHADRRKVG